MKKKLFLAATLFGAQMTTALANPFADVDTNHWAYDAVAQLAKDGVIEGYGDGTYVGDAAITRYEMAQMVARAMTKKDLTHADKAIVDKLAAEFADELNSLGVRVSALEKKTDNVKFSGSLRYNFRNARLDNSPKHGSYNNLRLFLSADATVNENWQARARLQYVGSMKDAKNIGANGSAFMDRAFVEGKYDNLTLRFGKFGYWTQVDDGLIFGGDNGVAGAQLVFGSKTKVSLLAGRQIPLAPTATDTRSYQAIEVWSDKTKLIWGLGYHLKKGEKDFEKKRIGIYEAGLGWRFDKKWSLRASYARAHKGVENEALTIANRDKYAYSVELAYGKLDRAKVGSFSSFIAYRHLGKYSMVGTRYGMNGAMEEAQRGINLGASVTLMPQIVGSLEYFQGKTTSADQTKAKTLFARLQAFF